MISFFGEFFGRNNRYNEMEGLEKFPILVMEPWRVEELIQEETVNQRFRLFKAINYFRLLGVILVAILLFVISQISSVVGVIMLLYAFLVFMLIVLAEMQKSQITRYGLFIGLFDVLLTGIVLVSTNSSVEFGALFVSILLSAMILPLISALLVTALASLLLFIAKLISSAQKLFLPVWDLNLSDWTSLFFELINQDNRAFTEVIFIPLGLFVLTVLVNQMTARSFKNEVRAQFRYKQLRQVMVFNRSVIEHLRSGVIVLTHDAKVVSINQRAIDLLNINTSNALHNLKDISGELLQRYFRWNNSELESNLPYKHNSHAQDVSVSFSVFGYKGSGVAMLTLESVNEALQQSQQAKLVSLGRLTAGVAHEIRNPLSSIKSANQLLKELTKDVPQAEKLAGMIDSNVERTNQIINDILGLFKDTKSERQLISLRLFLVRFAESFKKTNNDTKFELRLNMEEKQNVFVMFDEGQLEQVLWNLCQNAVKYAIPLEGENLKLLIRVNLTRSGQIHLDVSDNGQGIKPESIENIFEPFYTGGSGSGLGLYLARELCSVNNANVVYLENLSAGATFRVITQAFFTNKAKKT